MLVNSITQSYSSMNVQTLPDADAQIFSFFQSLEGKKEVDSADIEQFSRLLQEVDLDGYMMDGENLGILRSGLILLFTLDATMQNAEPLIDAVLERCPNLDLPCVIFPNHIPNSSELNPNAPFISFADFLRQIREREEALSSSEDPLFDITRVDKILDYVNQKR